MVDLQLKDWPELNAFDGVVKGKIKQQKDLQWLHTLFFGGVLGNLQGCAQLSVINSISNSTKGGISNVGKLNGDIFA
jgi:hypothetical protein